MEVTESTRKEYLKVIDDLRAQMVSIEEGNAAEKEKQISSRQKLADSHDEYLDKLREDHAKTRRTL